MTAKVTELDNQPTVSASQGGYDGADRMTRDLALWQPPVRSADGALLRDKDSVDARVTDIERNDAYVHGALQSTKDSVVGTYYRLNARPNWRHLGLDEVWAREYQEYVETRFPLYAESPENWMDARRQLTLTGMTRMALATVFLCGEHLASAEWLRAANRPHKTAIQLIDPVRLSNPDGMSDTEFLRKGVHRNRYGESIAFSIREAVAGEIFGFDKQWTWRTIRARKPWGRKQMLHYFDANRVDQSRGVADMVSALKGTKMAGKFKDVVLQNAVLNASYAAAIESDLPSQEVFQQMGLGDVGDGDFYTKAAENVLESIAAYTGNANNLSLDGVRIPHLYPGTKLKLQNAGQPGGVGTEFEDSLLRYTAAALGFSYEEFSQDFRKTNYSSFRGASLLTHRRMMAKKKTIADAFATDCYRLWLEEDYNSGDLKQVLPRNHPSFYGRLNAEAYAACKWIGAARGQIDEQKETSAAIDRIKSGLSTYEQECARFGSDWRDVFEQRYREQVEAEKMGLTLDLGSSFSAGVQPDAESEDEQDADDGGQTED